MTEMSAATETTPEAKRRDPTIFEQQKKALARVYAAEHGPGARELMAHQEDFVGHFLEYFKEAVEARRKSDGTTRSRMARIVAAPRTGKTTIAAEILRRTDLRGAFFVPTTNLVNQALNELRLLLPDKKIVQYSGARKENLVSADVVVATYSMGQSDMRQKGTLPRELRNMPIVFADEGHESTTAKRMRIMRDQFDSTTIRIALTGTPDYSEARKLEEYYPELIHAMTTPEAVELGLLSPLQYWVYEIDIDGSKVGIEGGDYSAPDIERIFSRLPVFKLMQELRYHESNRNTPALICFRTKQQANDAAAYLQRINPEGAGKIAVITEDTKDRDAVLSGFNRGDYDTLFTVQVLLRGWDAEQCKLLIDFDPTLSLVRAGQKFTRPLTKGSPEDDRVAKIYSVIPKHLPYLPLLPPDVLIEQDIEHPPGQLIGRPATSKRAAVKDIVPLPDTVEGIPVRLLRTLREYGGLRTVEIDRNNVALLQKIIMTGCDGDIEESREFNFFELLRSYRNFQNTFFDHATFRGYGRLLLWALKIKNKDDFERFFMEAFPEQYGTHLLMLEKRGAKALLAKEVRRRTWHEFASTVSTADDAQRLAEALHEGKKYPSAQEGLRALFGSVVHERGLDEKVDPFLWKAVEQALLKLTPREENVLLRRLKGDTLEEIGESYGITRTSIQIIYLKAVEKIRIKLLQQLHGKHGALEDIQAMLKGIELHPSQKKPRVLEVHEQIQLKQSTEEYVRIIVNQWIANLYVPGAAENKEAHYHVTLLRSQMASLVPKATAVFLDKLTPRQAVILFEQLVNKKQGAALQPGLKVKRKEIEALQEMLRGVTQELKDNLRRLVYGT